MKKYITKLIILFFIFEVYAEVYPKVDYMMLTRKSVPPMKILVDATIETMGINNDRQNGFDRQAPGRKAE